MSDRQIRTFALILLLSVVLHVTFNAGMKLLH